MPRIGVVHDEQQFLQALVVARSSAGYEVTTFTDPMRAPDALEAAEFVDVLVTRAQFRVGNPTAAHLPEWRG